MATRITTKRNPWRYTECGLDNIDLIGIKVRTNPESGVEEPIIPKIEDLHDCIFLGLLKKPGALTGKETRYMRGHLMWTQAQANEKLQQSSPQYFSTLERKADKPAFDLHTDFVWRLLCARAFHDHSTGRRKAEAGRIIRMLEQVETVLTAIKNNRTQPSNAFIQKNDEWQGPAELLAA
jgi:hypothetical protein